MSITKEKLIYDATTPSDGDSVASFLRTGDGPITSTVIGSALALDVNVLSDPGFANGEFTPSVVSVTTTAASLGAALAGRKRVMVQNLGNKAIFIGGTSDVASSGADKGIRIAAGGNMELPLGEGVALFAVAESGTQEVIFVQIA